MKKHLKSTSLTLFLEHRPLTTVLTVEYIISFLTLQTRHIIIPKIRFLPIALSFFQFLTSWVQNFDTNFTLAFFLISYPNSNQSYPLFSISILIFTSFFPISLATSSHEGLLTQSVLGKVGCYFVLGQWLICGQQFLHLDLTLHTSIGIILLRQGSPYGDPFIKMLMVPLAKFFSPLFKSLQ